MYRWSNYTEPLLTRVHSTTRNTRLSDKSGSVSETSLADRPMFLHNSSDRSRLYSLPQGVVDAKNHLWCFVLFASACSEYDLKVQQDPNLPGDGDTAAGFDTANPFDTSGSDGPIVDSGNSSPSGEKPVAVCEVSPNPVKPPAESAAWDGSGSYDPSGSGIDSYRWVLSSAPSGSSVAMPGGSSAVRGGFTPDLAGDYVGQLVVTNNNGVSSDPCEVTLESIPSEDLWVEMYWTESGDDMDLHFGPGGTIESNKDCYLPTVSPDVDGITVTAMHRTTQAWTSTTFQALDPKTSILKQSRMETSLSSCTTILHAPGCQSSHHQYLHHGAPTDTRSISGEDSYNEYAEINWPSGSVTALSCSMRLRHRSVRSSFDGRPFKRRQPVLCAAARGGCGPLVSWFGPASSRARKIAESDMDYSLSAHMWGR